jgi:hypothetical protein
MSVTSHFNFFGGCANLSEYPPKLFDGTEIETGTYKPYPIKLPISQCMRIFWGIKKWKMSLEWEYESLLDRFINTDNSSIYEIGSYIKGGGIASGITGDENWSGTFRPFIEKEKDLLCYTTDIEGSIVLEDWNYPITLERRLIVNQGTEEEPNLVTTDDTVEAAILFGISSGLEVFQEFVSRFSKDENNSLEELWTLLAISAQISFPRGRRFETPQSQVAESITATFELLDENIPISLGASFLNPPWIIKSEISNVVFGVHEWWTYDGKYNSETGLEN